MKISYSCLIVAVVIGLGTVTATPADNVKAVEADAADAAKLADYENDAKLAGLVREAADIDECLSNPCDHGTCIDGIDQYTCECQSGYEGEMCDENIDECLSNSCDNGTCKDGINQYTCECNPGYEGEMCDKNIDECLSNTCDHGTCKDGINQYTCECNPGYEGEMCDKNIDECSPNPCHHGQCIDGIDQYTCACQWGYVGEMCDENVDDCQSNPCVHGICKDGVDDYTCQCVEGYGGKNCNKGVHGPWSEWQAWGEYTIKSYESRALDTKQWGFDNEAKCWYNDDWCKGKMGGRKTRYRYILGVRKVWDHKKCEGWRSCFWDYWHGWETCINTAEEAGVKCL